MPKPKVRARNQRSYPEYGDAATRASVKSGADTVRRSERRLFALGIAAAAAILWLPPLSSSLWHDEAGTYWVAKEGFAETVDRAIRYQGQSPLYYLIVWVMLHLGGASEIILRLPSLLSLTVTAVLLFRLARKLID